MPQTNARTLALVTSGTTWAQLKTGGVQLLLNNLVTANAAKANPAAACTATATGGGASGGSLYVGTTATFFISYTNCDAFGETTPGSSELASALTVASTNIPQVTLPALPGGVDSRNIYVTAANGDVLQHDEDQHNFRNSSDSHRLADYVRRKSGSICYAS